MKRPKIREITHELREEWLGPALFILAVLGVYAIAAHLLFGCVPSEPPKAEVLEVPRRTCERWFRFGESVPEDVRALAIDASAGWRELGADRIRIAFGEEGRDVFTIVRDGTDEAARIDFLFSPPGIKTLGVTTTFDDGSVQGRVRVVILVDRISSAKLWRTVAHELGHSCGLSDRAEEMNVMTGQSLPDDPPLRSFGAADRAEVREKGYR